MIINVLNQQSNGKQEKKHKIRRQITNDNKHDRGEDLLR